MIYNIKILTLVFTSILLLSCKTHQVKQAPLPQGGMNKVTILYPNGEDKIFNLDYYEKAHMPMVAGLLGENLYFYEIDKGIAGRTPTDKVPFLAIGYFYIKDITQYNKVIGQNIETIRNDIKNYTNIQPIIQISEIKKLH